MEVLLMARKITPELPFLTKLIHHTKIVLKRDDYFAICLY